MSCKITVTSEHTSGEKERFYEQDCGRSYSYVDKGKRIFWECSGKYDLVRPCPNLIFGDSTYHAAWQRLCVKLKKHADDIIAPCVMQCEVLEDNFMSEEITQLEEQIKKLSERSRDYS